MDHDKDHLTRRCPRLGGPVSFGYCREPAGESLPCWKIFECWWEVFDVSAYLRKQLSEADFDRLMSAKPKPKVVSLLELIEKAKENVGAQKTDS